MSDEQVAPELKPIKTKLEGILGELKQLQANGTPTQAQVGTSELAYRVHAITRFVQLLCGYCS